MDPLPSVAPSAPSQPSPAEVATAAAAAVCADPVIADLLRRKSAGEKLTASEHGKIGNWKQRQKLPIGTGPAVAPAPAPLAGGASAGAPVAAAPADVAPLPPGDADLVRGTVAAVLVKINAVGQRHLLAAAKAAGADAAALDRFSRAEVVGEEDRRVLSETAPLVAASAGLDPRKVPLYAFLGTLGACGLNFYQAIAELKELEAEKVRRATAAPPAKA